MTRTSTDEYINGKLVNGYSYVAQVWVADGLVVDCNHPAEMRERPYYCCNGHRYAGKGIEAVEAVVMAAASAE